MTRAKKNVFVTVLAVMLVAVLTMTALVACGDKNPETVKVTFKDGETEVASVDVAKGTALELTAVPAAPAKDGYTFVGWFVGETKFDGTVTFDADTVFTAKYEAIVPPAPETVTVTFTDGEATVKTATVVKGEKIAEADLPANPTKDGYVFEGWFNGETAFDKDAEVSANVTYVAKWTGLHNVTFMNGDEVVKTISVKDGAVVDATQIPAGADTDYAFIGWFVNGEAYNANAAVTANVVVMAKYSVVKKDFFGTWRGLTDDWDPSYYTLVIDANGIVVSAEIPFDEDYDEKDSSFANVSATDIVFTEGETKAEDAFTFKVGESNYEIHYYYDGVTPVVLIGEATSFKISAELEGRVKVTDSELIGTYKTESDVTIRINTTFVTVDGVNGKKFYYRNYNGYSFEINNVQANISYDEYEGKWMYYNSPSSYGEEIIIPPLVSVDVPEAFHGNWYALSENYGSQTATLIKIAADGVYSYIPAIGWEKAGVVTAATESKLTIVNDSETITATLADGKLSYVGDSMYSIDVELTKGAVVVFMSDYSVYQVLTVNEEGKVEVTFSDPQKEAYRFDGWIKDLDETGEATFDEDAVYTESAMFNAKFTKSHYILTYKNGNDTTKILIPVGTTLSAEYIAPAPTAETGFTFMGWYTGTDKAENGMKISKDITFTAQFLQQSDFYGTWLITTEGKEKMLKINESKFSFNTFKDVEYTYNAATGEITATPGTGRDFNSFVITKTVSGVNLAHKHLDNIGEDYETDEYTFTKKAAAISGVAAGTYTLNNSSKFTIEGDGSISFAETSETNFGYISGYKSSLTLYFRTAGSSTVTKITKVRVDSNGNLGFGALRDDAAIYVKDVTAFKSYYNSEDGYIYKYTTTSATFNVRASKAADGTYRYAYITNVDGEIAEGKIFTVTYGLYNGTSTKKTVNDQYKIVEGSLTKAGAEKGEYTNETYGTATVDGFGNCTVTKDGVAKEYTYTINGVGNVILADADENIIGVSFDADAHTYTMLTSDGKEEKYEQSGSSYYSLIIDGFGGATIVYKTSSSTKLYNGTYTYSTDGKTLTIKNTTYGYNQAYSVEEGGKVLASADGKKIFAVSGVSLDNHAGDFIGLWVNGDQNIEITVDSNNKVSISINGATAIAMTGNWNGTVFTFKGEDADNANSGYRTFDANYTVIMKDGKVVLSHYCAVGFDDGGDVVYATTATEVSYEKGTKTLDGLEGTYVKGSSTITLDGKGNGVYNNGTREWSFTYTGTGTTKNVCSFGLYDDDSNTFTVTATGITVSFSGEFGNYEVKGEFTKQGETLDAFAGTWTGKVGANTWNVVCDGKGNITVNGTAYTYTVGSTSITAGDSVITIKNDKMHVEYDDGEYSFSGDLVKA